MTAAKELVVTKIGTVLLNSIFLTVLFVASKGVASAEDTPSKPLFSAFDKFYRFRATAARVETGNAADALYYYESVAKALRMPESSFPQRLDELLRWAGCTASAARLEKATPAELNKANFGVTSLRYFSPKTTDVSGRQKPQLLSWRKIMRVSASPESQAAKAGIREIWWLTNVYTPAATAPFEQSSQNNQIILVPEKPLKITRGENIELHSILFAVYGSAAKGYPLARSTSTSWDGGMANVDKPDDPTQEYFVPQSCIQCHGGGTRNGRLNVVDTDYYIWRSQDHAEFPAMTDEPWWTKDSQGFDFAAAYDLNKAILLQNQTVDMEQGLQQTFYTKLTQDWVKRHDNTFRLVAPSDRGWEGEQPELTGLLTKYCYRCHGTVGFSVLDGDRIRGNVDGRLEAILDRLQADMPQDRSWEDNPTVDADLKRLRKLLGDLPAASKAN